MLPDVQPPDLDHREECFKGISLVVRQWVMIMGAFHVWGQAETNQFRIAHAISDVYGVATVPFHGSRQSDSSPPEMDDRRNTLKQGITCKKISSYDRKL